LAEAGRGGVFDSLIHAEEWRIARAGEATVIDIALKAGPSTRGFAVRRAEDYGSMKSGPGDEGAPLRFSVSGKPKAIPLGAEVAEWG